MVRQVCMDIDYLGVTMKKGDMVALTVNESVVLDIYTVDVIEDHRLVNGIALATQSNVR